MDGEESIHTHAQIFTRTSSVVLHDIIEQILMYKDGSKRIKAKEKKNIQQLRTKLYYTDTE